jgi:Radical SAM superfamily
MMGQPSPFLPIEYVKRTAGTNSSFDAGRGCPFQCSFCTIINVQGRKSRSRTPDDVESVIRENWREGISRFFLTDDNFARNREWEPILDRLIRLREVDAIPLGLMIQVDTLCHKIPGFIEKCKRAGVTRVFIGLENINPDNLKAVKKPRTRSPNTAKCSSPGKRKAFLPMWLYPRFARRHRRIDPPRHRDHPTRAAARYRRMGDPHFPAPKIIRSCGDRASPWTVISTTTISSMWLPTIPR